MNLNKTLEFMLGSGLIGVGLFDCGSELFFWFWHMQSAGQPDIEARGGVIFGMLLIPLLCTAVILATVTSSILIRPARLGTWSRIFSPVIGTVVIICLLAGLLILLSKTHLRIPWLTTILVPLLLTGGVWRLLKIKKQANECVHPIAEKTGSG